MRKLRRLVVVAATALTACGVLIFWKHSQPRRIALQKVSKLADNLANHHGSELLEIVVMPAAVRSQTPAEQQQFIAKALADEISPEGVLALKQHAQFGLAKSIFP